MIFQSIVNSNSYAVIFVRDLIMLLKLILLYKDKQTDTNFRPTFPLTDTCETLIPIKSYLCNNGVTTFQLCETQIYLPKCLFHTIHTIFKTAIFSALLDTRNNHIHRCSSLKDWQFVKHIVFFSVDLFPHS